MSTTLAPSISDMPRSSREIRNLTASESRPSVVANRLTGGAPQALEISGIMSLPQNATIFVVDDDEAMCRMIQSLVESVGLRAEVYSSARDFVEAYRADRPGCLVTDVRMPGMSGVELQEWLMREKSLLPVILVTAHADVPLAVRAMKSQAVDVIEKPFKLQDLLDRVQHAVRLDADRRAEHEKKSAAVIRIASLTDREYEVMSLVVAGLANKQIAHRLDLSEKTIEAHRSHVMKKVGASSVAELVRISTLAQ